MRFYYLTLILAFSINNLIVAQTISPVLLSPMGTYSEASGFSLSHSVGEIGIETAISNGRTLTQGFQQPNEFVVLYTQEQKIESSLINVYPNPFRDQLNLSIKTFENAVFRVHIYDISGQQIKEPMLLSQGMGQQLYTLDVMGFSQGIYIIRVIEKDGTKVTDFKIIRM